MSNGAYARLRGKAQKEAAAGAGEPFAFQTTPSFFPVQEGNQRGRGHPGRGEGAAPFCPRAARLRAAGVRRPPGSRLAQLGAST